MMLCANDDKIKYLLLEIKSRAVELCRQKNNSRVSGRGKAEILLGVVGDVMLKWAEDGN